MGTNGGKYINAGESGDADVTYLNLLVITDATFSVLDQKNFDANSSAGAKAAKLAVTYLAGTVIYGQTTGVTVATGLIQAFDKLNVDNG
jgi:hypothetical protein